MFFSQKRAFSLGKKLRGVDTIFGVLFFGGAAMTRTLMKKTPRCGQAFT
jgi:hypothetical protein